MSRFLNIILYLDPNTGSLLIQFLIAGIFGVILFFKQILLRIKYLYYRLFRKKPEDEL